MKDNEKLGLPDDTSLPFFNYGVFKNWPKVYSNLSNHMKNRRKSKIQLFLKKDDGYKILTDKKINKFTYGDIINFNSGNEKAAYQIISDNLSKIYYKWETKKTVNGTEVNVPIEANRELDLPDNINLPFFGYGIFKPGQIAYSKIKNLVIDQNNSEINHQMMLRDGVPILIEEEKNEYTTKGVILNFSGYEEEAYEIISNTLVRKLYKWDTIKINGNEVNVLFGVNPKNGGEIIKIDDEEIYKCDFNGRTDPYFNKALDLVGDDLDKDIYHHEEGFFELQMKYMLLWSAIDRYTSIKYNLKSKGANNHKFANEDKFKQGLKTVANDGKKHYHRDIFSSEDLQMHHFDANDSEETIKYYYTLRCNIVHRGKMAPSKDCDIVKTATEELLTLFKEVLADTFGQNYSKNPINI